VGVLTRSRHEKALLSKRKIDAFLALPPDPAGLRARNIGHVSVKPAHIDRPWSQQFCCVVDRQQGFRAQLSSGDQACCLRKS